MSTPGIRKRIDLLAAMLMLPCMAGAQIILHINCGNEYAVPCTSSDPSFLLNNTFQGTGNAMPCDYGLAVVGGLCQNGVTSIGGILQTSQPPRYAAPAPDSWTRWALAQQRYGIGGDAPINFITTVGTHNSFSNRSSSFNFWDTSDQLLSITDQLNLGARYIRVDAYLYYGEMRLCHGDQSKCVEETFIGATSGRLFANAMIEVGNWLDNHPSEFIILDLNGDPTSGNDERVITPILTYIGANRIVNQNTDISYRNCPNAQAVCYYPSLNWALSQGKQVLIIANNYGNYTASNQQYLVTRNWLDEMDPYDGTDNVYNNSFTNCSSTQTHPNYRWSYASEDRSGSVIGTSAISSRSDFIGYLDESQVAHATGCAFSIVAFDFLNARSLTFPDPNASTDGWPTPVTTDADNRFNSSIWSFQPGDFGSNGYAYMAGDHLFITTTVPAGRWSTLPAATSMKFACSTSTGFNFNDSWFISDTAGAWDATQGEAACAAKGGHFNHPYNGAQNASLAAAAGTSDVWLNYRTQALPQSFGATPAQIAASIAPGGAPPASQQITLFGPANASVPSIVAYPAGSTTDVSWVSLPGSITLNSAGNATLTVSYNNNISNLAAGLYQALIVLNSATSLGGNGTTFAHIMVNLVVKGSVLITTSCPAIGLESLPVTCNYSFATTGISAVPNVGDWSVTSTSVDSFGVTRTNTTSTMPFLGSGSFSLSLPPGQSSIVTSFSGDNNFLAASSLPAIVTITSSFNPQPASETLNYVFGSNAPISPAPVAFVPDANVQLSISNATWLSAGISNNSAANLSLNNVASLTPGVYTAGLVIADGTGARASVNVPITLNVTTTMSASNPPTLVVTPGSSPVSGSISVNTASASAIPMSASSNVPWLAVAGQGSAPTTLNFIVNPALLGYGSYAATVTLTSPVAPSVAVSIKVYSVPASRVTTSVAGQTVTIDGVACTTPCVTPLAPGSHTLVAPAQFIYNTVTKYGLQSWNGGSPGQTTTTIQGPVTPADLSLWTATYNVTGYLVQFVSSQPASGSVLLAPSSSDGFYSPGSQVTASSVIQVPYAFQAYSGSVNSTTDPYTFTVGGPVSDKLLITQVAAVTSTFDTSPSGLGLSIDGVAYATPVRLPFVPGGQHTIAAVTTIANGAGARYAFSAWSDATATASRTIFAPAVAGTYIANYNTQYLLTLASNPVGGGSISIDNPSADGYYTANSPVNLTATPSAGFTFAGFSGTTTRSANPIGFRMNSPVKETANFNTPGGPLLIAVTSGNRIPGDNSTLTVPLAIENNSTSGVGGIQITGIDGVQIISGSGPVNVVTPTAFVGDLAPNATSAPVAIVFTWPASISRLRFTVHFSADGGAYSGSTVLTVSF